MLLTSVVHLVAIILLATIAIVDWRIRQIWHLLTIPGALAAFIASPHLPSRFWLNALVGSLAAFILFLAIRLLATRYYGSGSFGFGDVMLAMLIGAIGGINGLLWLAMGMLLAGVYAGWLKWWGNSAESHQPKTHIAYGSFLAIAAIGGLVAKVLFVL